MPFLRVGCERSLEESPGDRPYVRSDTVTITGSYTTLLDSTHLLRGHEVKVSRADWLHELDEPGKAETWASQCHEWWLVTPHPSIVNAGELPAGWGHMVPDPRSKNRFKILVPATAKPPTSHPRG